MSEFNFNEGYEHLAARFFEETNFIAPGKDVPAECAYCENDEAERQKLWREFMSRRNTEAWTLWHQKYGYLMTTSRSAG